jgi:hypothetical protein
VLFEGNSSLKEIGSGAFLESGVTSIEVPEKCEILEGALVGVESVSISRSNPFFMIERDFVMSKDKRRLIHYFGSSSRIAISNSVEFIVRCCFSWCESMIEVIFEDECDLKRIDEFTFSCSGLKSIQIPKSVEFIGEYCFSECHSLIEVIFEYECDLKRIDERAFSCS